MLLRLILATGDPPLERRLRALLRREDVVLESLAPSASLWSRVAAEPADILLVSRSLVPEPPEDAVRTVRNSPETTAVLVFAREEAAHDRARLLAAGCEAVVSPDLSDTILHDLLREVVGRRRQLVEARLRPADRRDGPRLSDFATASPAMQTFMEVVARVVDSDTTLLIQGETGVGKERLARAIHAESRRSDGPFVAVNCAGLPETLLESELFGHEEGSFTGATRARRGRFEMAHGGVLLLDEIGEMPLHLQVKLLRALQEREIQAIGAEKPIRVDVRVVAATNRELEDAVESGEFRRDLYYRLGVVTLTLPPLRERREDVPELARSYVEYFAGVVGRAVQGLTADAIRALTEYAWPGNVRELMNVIERAVLLADGPDIGLAELPEPLGRVEPPAFAGVSEAAEVRAGVPDAWLARPWAEVRREALLGVEKAYLAALLRDTRGRVGETATRAGIQPRSLYEKMRRHGLRKEDFRRPEQDG